MFNKFTELLYDLTLYSTKETGTNGLVEVVLTDEAYDHLVSDLQSLKMFAPVGDSVTLYGSMSLYTVKRKNPYSTSVKQEH